MCFFGPKSLASIGMVSFERFFESKKVKNAFSKPHRKELFLRKKQGFFWSARKWVLQRNLVLVSSARSAEGGGGGGCTARSAVSGGWQREALPEYFLRKC